MTKLTYNIYCNTNSKVLATEFTYPRAKQVAEEIGNCVVVPVYTSEEIKDHTEAKHRLIARV